MNLFLDIFNTKKKIIKSKLSRPKEIKMQNNCLKNFSSIKNKHILNNLIRCNYSNAAVNTKERDIYFMSKINKDESVKT